MRKDRDYKDKCTKVTLAGKEDNRRKKKRENYGKGVKGGRGLSRARKEGRRLEAGDSSCEEDTGRKLQR